MMKSILLKILLALVITHLTSVITNSQTWKELMDSCRVYQSRNDYQKGLNLAEAAKEKIINELGILDTNYYNILVLLAENAYQLGDYQKSFYYLKEDSALIFQNLGSRNMRMADVMDYLTLNYESVGMIKEAESLFKQILDIKKEITGENDLSYAVTLNNFGLFHYYFGDLNKAQEFMTKAIDTRKSILGEIDKDYAIALHNLSLIYLKKGKPKDALPYSEKAVKILKQVLGPEDIDYAVDLSNYGSINEQLGNMESAINIHEEVLSIFLKKLGPSHYYTSNAYIALGLSYNRSGRYTEAEKVLILAVENNLKNFGAESREYAISIHNLALNYQNQGEYHLAEYYDIKACEILKKVIGEYNVDYAIDLSTLALTYIYLGKYKEAEIKLLNIADIFSKTIGEKNRYYAYALNQLAFLYQQIGNATKSVECSEKAISLYKEFSGENSLDYAFANHHKAQALLDLGEFNESIIHSETALNILRNQLGELNRDYLTDLMPLAIAHQNMGNYVKAEEIFKNMVEISKLAYGANSAIHAKFLIDLAVFYSFTGRDIEALRNAKESLNFSINQSINMFKYLSEREKLAFSQSISRHLNFFYSLVFNSNIIDINDLLTVFDFRVSTKSNILNSTQKVRKRILASGDTNLINKYFEWISLREQTSKINSESEKSKAGKLDSLTNNLNKLEKELTLSSELFKSNYEFLSEDINQISSSLGAYEAFIEIISLNKYGKVPNINKPDIVVPGETNQVLYAFLIVKKESKYPELVLLKNGNELEGKYIELYKHITNQQRKVTFDLDKIDVGLKELFQQFWTPVHEKLNGIKTVHLSPDGIYNILNLNTLINPETNKYLLDEIDLRIVTSTRDLVERNPQSASFSEGVGEVSIAELFGDPQFDLDSAKYIQLASNIRSNTTREYYSLGNTLDSATRGAIAPLPGTRKEIENISASFRSKGWEINKHLGPEALEEALKAVDNPRVLHIATHGKFLKDVERRDDERMMGFETQRFVENPLLRSMLLFSGAENTLLNQGQHSATQREDGLLTAYEAQNLNLDNTELVVLSACETGLGEVRNGEGVYGLQRAFQVAGAKSLIMSLWSVSDEATQELMTSFYSKWLGGKSKREAFREAQMELKKKYPGFYYWGAFVMVGE